MKIDGGCHCRFLTYEAEVDPESAGICHCTDCQSLSGTAFRTGVTAHEDDFRFLSGEPKIYQKTAESGNQRQQVFCPNCGTQIYSTSLGPAGGRSLRLRAGTVTQRDQLPPKRQIWIRSAQSWVGEIDQILKIEKQGN
jgi:hypothetical protein